MSDSARLSELRTQLKSRIENMDRVSAAFKMEEKGVVVSSEQRDDFRKNLAEAKEIKGLIDDLEGKSSLEAYLSEPQGGSAAMQSQAQLAGGNAGVQLKTLGQRFTGSDEFKALVKSGALTMQTAWELGERDIAGGYGQKDVFTGSVAGTTSRGFGQVQRDAMIPMPQRTARVRDLFPVTGTQANLIDYFRVSGFTNNAATVPERAADGTAFGLKPQSELSFTVGQAPVRTIAHFEVAHRNVLADEPQLQATIDNELMYGLRLVEDAQILTGSGTGEDLLGILNTPGIQTYAQTTDGGTPAVTTETKADAVRRAATRSILAYYEPSGLVMHPYDWEDIELTKDSQGAYIIAGNVAVGAQKQMWRMPVVDTPAITEGTFLVGSFGLGAQLYDREQANIRIAEQHADFFIRNAVAILAEERLALAVKRPESFVKGSFAA